jgi:hypothetical protein
MDTSQRAAPTNYCVVEDFEDGATSRRWQKAAYSMRFAGVSFAALLLLGLGLAVSWEARREGMSGDSRADGETIVSMEEAQTTLALNTTIIMTTTTGAAAPPTTIASGIITSRQFPCGIDRLMVETDLKTAEELRKIEHIPMKYCAYKCEEDSNCAGWTWGKQRDVFGLSDTCFMKKVRPGELMRPTPNGAVVSGIPCHHHLQEQQPSRVKLFCWALMIPHTYEQHLLAWQFEESISLFGCDRFAVYSNMSIEVAPGFFSLEVDSTLHCKKGGEFGTALNNDIFLTVWKEVFKNPDMRSSDWTVKVDPDCVFVPARLRLVLQSSGDPVRPQGAYLNNCWRGMHGPIEVLSTSAVSTYVDGYPNCAEHFRQACSGDCLWGEDMFMDQCLWHVLKVKRDDAFSLLVEDHCDPPVGWQSCEDQQFVAYHPFKNISGYKQCLEGTKLGGPR